MNRNTKNSLLLLLAILTGMLLIQCNCKNTPTLISEEMIQEAEKKGETFLVGVLRRIKEGKEIDINEANEFDDLRRTALHVASKLGSIDIVNTLIAKGADMEVKDEDGFTPLHLAASFGNSEVINTLIAKGADIEAKNKYGDTPLHLAALMRNSEVAWTLIGKKANIEAKNNNGKPPLSLAISSKDLDTIMILIATKSVNSFSSDVAKLNDFIKGANLSKEENEVVMELLQREINES